MGCSLSSRTAAREPAIAVAVEMHDPIASLDDATRQTLLALDRHEPSAGHGGLGELRELAQTASAAGSDDRAKLGKCFRARPARLRKLSEAVGWSATRQDALIILSLLTSDRFDARASETRQQLQRYDLIDRVVPLVYLSPRALSSGRSSAGVMEVVYHALGVQRNLCLEAECRTRAACCRSMLRELAGTSDWASAAIQHAAEACLSNHQAGGASARTCTDPHDPERSQICPARPRPPTAATPSQGVSVGGARAGGRSETRGNTDGTGLLRTVRGVRRADDGVIAVLTTLPTFEYLPKASPSFGASAGADTAAVDNSDGGQCTRGREMADTTSPHAGQCSGEVAEGATCGESDAAAAPSAPPVCAVCLEEFAIGDQLRGMPCGHVFHMECVDKWLLSCAAHRRFSCPSCRYNLCTPAEEDIR